jgi:hypothetical protein
MPANPDQVPVVAVAIGSVRACPNGFEFTLHTRLRHEDETGPVTADPLERHGRWRGRQVPGDVGGTST